MQGQCTRCRCRWPWGGHGKGRRAAAGVGSSYLVRQDLLAVGLHSQPFASLAGLVALAGTTATGPGLEHWLGRGGGSAGAKQAKKSASKGRFLPPSSFFLSPPFCPRQTKKPLKSTLPTQVPQLFTR